MHLCGFLIDVGTAIADKSEGSVREEGLPYEALNLLIQRLLRAIDIIGRSSPNQKRLMWGYRCFDARSAVGCTPKELDKSIWKRPNGQTIPFRPLDAKSVEAMQRDVAKIVSKGDAMRKSTSSIKLSQREILERSVNEVASEFWSEMSNIGIGGRTDDRHATIVLSPCPCSASNLAHFMSDTDGTVSVVGGTRSASAIAPTDMGGLAAASAASRKTLEEATLRGLDFFTEIRAKFRRRGLALPGLYWMQPLRTSTAYDVDGVDIIRGTLQKHFDGDVIQIEPIIATGSVLPLRASVRLASADA